MSNDSVKTRRIFLLTYDCGLQAISAGIEFARQRGIALSFVALDSMGHLVASARMDGAPFLTAEVARGKAFACVASGGQPGDVLAQRFNDNPMVWSNAATLGFGAPLLPGRGALPIYLDGELVGAIGASGAPSEIDEAAVRHAIASIGGSTTPGAKAGS
jgi:glc operon protein GlcG